MTGNARPGGGRIVVGVDGTAASPIAVRWAVQEALLRQASVHLVFVARQYPRASYSGSPVVSPSVEDDAGRRAPLPPRSWRQAGPCRRIACHLS